MTDHMLDIHAAADELRRVADEAQPAGPATDGETRPRRGDAFEAWLKTERDSYGSHAANDREMYDILDNLLDQYRLHADMGVPLSGHVCEGRVAGDCECLEQPADEAQPAEAHPAEHTWAAELFDPAAKEWVPGTRYSVRDRAVNALEHGERVGPAWKDGTPTKRRLVRATTTYTVEEPAVEAQPAQPQTGEAVAIPPKADTKAGDAAPHIYMTAVQHQAGWAHDFLKAGRVVEALEHVGAIERLAAVTRRAVAGEAAEGGQ
jgi:hypothetical protein